MVYNKAVKMRKLYEDGDFLCMKLRVRATPRLPARYLKRHIIRITGAAVLLVMIAGCGISIFGDMLEYSKKQSELDELKVRAEQLEAENAEYESILNEEDERTYMERIAIEKLGYAYPDERRFYDTTRN